MNKDNRLITAGIIFLLWFSLAFACKSSSPTSGTTTDKSKSSDLTTKRRPSSTSSGIGSPYGTRDPRACGDLTGSSPDDQMAKDSFICNAERVFGSNIYLVEDVSVEVGRSRPYNVSQDSMDMPNIDTTVDVYTIQGSFKQYQCGQVSDYMQNTGKNCTLSDNPNAEGLCYKTARGEWVCKMTDPNNRLIKSNIAPPE